MNGGDERVRANIHETATQVKCIMVNYNCHQGRHQHLVITGEIEKIHIRYGGGEQERYFDESNN